MKKQILFLIICLSVSFSAQAKIIKILAIGNSFSADAIEQYLYELAAEGGDSLVIGNAYRAGQGFESHWKVAEQNKANFKYHKIVGGKNTNQRKTLLECIQDEEWDYITFQQASQDSGDYATYEPWLTQLLEYVKQYARNPKVKYALHRTWAYSQSSDHRGFHKYGKDQLQMFKKIVEATNLSKKQHKEFCMIIPAGTAIQNGRSSMIGDNFNRDGYHLSLGLGRYTAACTWLEKITKQKAVGKKFRPKDVSEEEALIAQKAAHYAVRHPDVITEIKIKKK
ncbi:DUF4886 domain-containing protein [Bacteroides sp.]|uniref:DUF4886 domain-containing protein n=1 Tax=Bacteroides sp. TaxID=29523 RepID=UPI00261131EB|nr:DUF4886 domain-containing protein [Bacteroides sp.]MDD3038194.1 DUF4886 domain-containing protein [Bacteroides sp.]